MEKRKPMDGRRMIAEELIIAVLLCVMVLLVAGQVLSRYVLHTSLSYTEELVRYAFVWATFLGVSAAVFRGRHLSIAGAFRFFTGRLKRLIGIACWIGALVFAAILVYYGVGVVFLQVRTRQTTAALGFPMWIVGLAIPVCSLLLGARLIQKAATGPEKKTGDRAE